MTINSKRLIKSGSLLVSGRPVLAMPLRISNFNTESVTKRKNIRQFRSQSIPGRQDSGVVL